MGCLDYVDMPVQAWSAGNAACLTSSRACHGRMRGVWRLVHLLCGPCVGSLNARAANSIAGNVAGRSMLPFQ